MVGISGGGGGGGYDYVQNGTPSGAEEGEEWYDTGGNAAYVYDGANWIEQTVTDHGQLSGVSASDHHTKPTSTQNAGAGQSWKNYSNSRSSSSWDNDYYYPGSHSAFMQWNFNDSNGDGGWELYVTVAGTEYQWTTSKSGWDTLPYGGVDEIRVRWNPNSVGDTVQTDDYTLDVLTYERQHGHSI